MPNLFQEIARNMLGRRFSAQQAVMVPSGHYAGLQDVVSRTASGFVPFTTAEDYSAWSDLLKREVSDEEKAAEQIWLDCFSEEYKASGLATPIIHAVKAQNFLARDRVPIAPMAMLHGDHASAQMDMFHVTFDLADGHLFIAAQSNGQLAARAREEIKTVFEKVKERMAYRGFGADLVNELWEAHGSLFDLKIKPLVEKPVAVTLPMDLTNGKTSTRYFARFELDGKIANVAPGGAAFDDDGNRIDQSALDTTLCAIARAYANDFATRYLNDAAAHLGQTQAAVG